MIFRYYKFTMFLFYQFKINILLKSQAAKFK